MGKPPKDSQVDLTVLCPLSNENLRVMNEYEILLICILLSCSCLFHDGRYNMSGVDFIATLFCIYSMQRLLVDLLDPYHEGRHGAASAVLRLRHHPLRRHFAYDATGSEPYGEEMACAPRRPVINLPTLLCGSYTYVMCWTYYKDGRMKDSQDGGNNACRAGQSLVVPIWFCGRGTPVKLRIDCLVKYLYCGCCDKQLINQDAGQP